MSRRFRLEQCLIIHNLALEAGIAGAVVAHSFFGSPWAAALLFAVGAVASLTLRSVLPIPVFHPVGGSYHVGIRHIVGDPRSQRPPICAYYPTLIPPSQELEPWLPHENDVRYLEGLASYGGVPHFVMRHLSLVGLRCTRNAAPLPLWINTSGTHRPIIVFSHGLAANYQLYSLLAMDLAARGAVVLVMEHQDGSSSFTRDAQGAMDDVAGMKYVVCQSPAGSPQERLFREGQLEHRRQELEAVIGALENRSLLHMLCFSRKDMEDVRIFGRDTLTLSLAGHSFGGATSLQTAVTHCIQKQKINIEGVAAPVGTRLASLVNPINVRIGSVAAFDAWHMPMQHTTLALLKDWARDHRDGGNSSSQLLKLELPPILLLDSQEWQRFPSSVQFQRELQQAVHHVVHGRGLPLDSNATTATSSSYSVLSNGIAPFAQEETAGTDHMSVCDLSVLSPVFSRKGLRVKGRQQITLWSRRLLQHVTAAQSNSHAHQ